MNALNIIEVTLGLLFIYILGSIVVTSVNQVTVSGFLRNRGLKKGIHALLHENEDYDEGADFFKASLIKNLGDPKKITFIPPKTFALALISYQGDEISVTNDNVNLIKKKDTNSGTEKTVNTLFALPGSKKIKNLKNIEEWFNNTMDHRIRDWYTRWISLFSFIFSSIVVVLLNLDTIMIARELWMHPIIDKLVENSVPRFNPDSAPETLSKAEFENMMAKLDSALNHTIQKNYIIGWNISCRHDLRSLPSNWIEGIEKIVGLLTTAIAISLGAKFWFEKIIKVLNAKK